MSNGEAWHSLKQKVHHDHPQCPEGKAIAPADLRAGTGGRPLCERCVRLSQEKRT